MRSALIGFKPPIFIKLTDKKYQTQKSKYKTSFALYECFCGNIFEAATPRVKIGHIKSCGCLSSKITIARNTKHKLSNHRLYNIFTDMKTRCYNVHSSSYNNYGGRGITICDEWYNDFMSFYNWAISNGHESNLSIDRIDNDGNYEPSNCRWATKEVQARNSRVLRANNKSGYRGVSFDKSKKSWVSQITIYGNNKNIGIFKTSIEAAKAYDKFVIDNNLEHTTNKIL